MMVEIIALDSSHKGQIGWEVTKIEAESFHDQFTLDYWELFVFLAHQEGDEYYGSTFGFMEAEIKRL